MPALNSTFLILIAVIVLAVALGGVIAFLYVRARRNETGESSSAPASQKDVLRQKEEQVTKIRQRIEELYQQQQQEQRIQHAQLSQQMDDVKLHIETNDRKVDGLRSELHHEIERRNQELDELKHQLAGALDSFWKAHDALPEGPSTAPRMLTAGSEPAAKAPEPSAPATPEPATFEPVPQEPAAPPASEPAATPELEWQSFDFAAEVSSDDSPAVPVEAASFDEPSGDSSTPDAPLPTFASFASLTSTPATPTPEARVPEASVPAPSAPPPSAPPPSAPQSSAPAPSAPAAPPAPAPEPPAPARPEGADVLTVISGIDDAIEQQLYGLDVKKLDQIARWSRSEARRIAQELGLKPQVVMDQWVFEAQSVLFDQYQQQLA